MFFLFYFAYCVTCYICIFGLVVHIIKLKYLLLLLEQNNSKAFLNLNL